MKALIAAVQGGADAVYLAGKMFGARSSANNFEFAELKIAVEYAHVRDVKVYAAVNTLIKDSEYHELAGFITQLCDCGIDALIVQDIGLLEFLRLNNATIPIHASTQMTIHNKLGIDFAASCGIARVVLPRELSIGEIAELTAYASLYNIETEVFIHGALCYAISGQCLMSSIIGGRSGNRGKCAQPCRLPYALEYSGKVAPVNVKFPLSTKDLQSFEYIGQLIECGVASLKIEGRLKPAEYVYAVTKAYRQAINDYYAGKLVNFDATINKTFNRDFTDGYLAGQISDRVLSSYRPNNRGELIGIVGSIGEQQLLELQIAKDDLFVADLNGIERSLKVSVINGKPVIDSLKSLPANAILYRVRDSVFEKTIQNELESEARKTPIELFCKLEFGKPLKLSAVDNRGNNIEMTGEKNAEVAQKVALSVDKIVAQLSKTGSTPYQVIACNCEIADGLALPISEINETRRKLLENLSATRLKNIKKHEFRCSFQLPKNSAKVCASVGEIIVCSDSEQTLSAALLLNEVQGVIALLECLNNLPLDVEQLSRLAKLAQVQGKRFYLEFPKVIFPGSLAQFQLLTEKLRGVNISGIYGSVGAKYFAEILSCPLFAGMGTPIYNTFAIDKLVVGGYSGGVLSPELNFEQILRLNIPSDFQTEILAYGRLEIMQSRICQIGVHFSQKVGEHCKGLCKVDNRLKLIDRTDVNFLAVTDQFCNTHLFNSRLHNCAGNCQRLLQSGVNRFRVDARLLSTEEMQRACKQLFVEINGGVAAFFNQVQHTRGHLQRGVE